MSEADEPRERSEPRGPGEPTCAVRTAALASRSDRWGPALPECCRTGVTHGGVAP
ncbi:MAG: hypothetical protein QM655_03785 [Nocardioidaceae bacterium]